MLSLQTTAQYYVKHCREALEYGRMVGARLCSVLRNCIPSITYEIGEIFEGIDTVVLLDNSGTLNHNYKLESAITKIYPELDGHIVAYVSEIDSETISKIKEDLKQLRTQGG